MSMAFVFPGQGSQYVGMGKELFDNYPIAADILKRADEVMGFSLSRLCFEGPEEVLNLTVNTQPALLAVSFACLEVLRTAGMPEPVAVAGHSLGEYSALVAAGSLSFEDALRLVRLRGKYMQEAVPPGEGGMAAVLGLPAETVVELCREARGAGLVEAVNLNCPGQVVVAGEISGLKEAEQIARKAGASRFIYLPVSAPFHSSLMLSAGEKLAEDLERVEIKEPALQVVANASAAPVQTGPEIMASLVRQVYSPVRWEESIQRMLSNGVNVFIEVGPGRVLCGLIKKISRAATVYNTGDKASAEKVLALVREVS